MLNAHYEYELWYKQKTPVEVIKEGTIGGTYFRDIYFVVNGKCYRKS